MAIAAGLAMVAGGAVACAPFGAAGDSPSVDAPAEAAGIVHRGTQTGGATDSTTVVADMIPADADRYFAAISTKPAESVVAVAGLGLSWSHVDTQCGARGQTAVEIWTAIGSPPSAGPVTATFQKVPSAAVIAVARYTGVGSIGTPASANTAGADGMCIDGIDTASFAIDLPSSPGRALTFGAVALRAHVLTAGAGVSKLIEVHEGASGSTAGIGVLESSASSLTATLDGMTDWAVIALPLSP